MPTTIPNRPHRDSSDFGSAHALAAVLIATPIAATFVFAVTFFGVLGWRMASAVPLPW